MKKSLFIIDGIVLIAVGVVLFTAPLFPLFHYATVIFISVGIGFILKGLFTQDRIPETTKTYPNINKMAEKAVEVAKPEKEKPQEKIRLNKVEFKLPKVENEHLKKILEVRQLYLDKVISKEEYDATKKAILKNL